MRIPNSIAITSRATCGGLERLVQACVELVQAGQPAIMLREKDLPGGELYSLATRLRAIVDGSRTLLLINDRVDVAIAVRAHGVHLGRTALPLDAARRICPLGMIFGVSCHSREEVLEAEQQGADYAVLSPVFSPSSKDDRRKPLGLDGFRNAAHGVTIPILALGGMNESNFPELRAAGAHGIAAISTFFAPGANRSRAVELIAALASPA